MQTPTPSSTVADAVAGTARYQLVALDQLHESTLNPRKQFDERKLAELVASVAQYGIVEPLVVRPSAAEGAASTFELVAGHRRFRAARAAGLTQVPVMVRELTDAMVLELALQENLHQATMSPVDEAQALTKLAELDPLYRDPRVAASKIGRSETYVRNRLRLLRLAPEVIEALAAEAITVSHAERIARLPVDQHVRALAECFWPGRWMLPWDDIQQLRQDPAHQAAAAAHQLDVDFLIAIRDWDRLRPIAGPLAALETWIRDHGKADLSAPEVQTQLLETLATDADAVDQTTAEEIATTAIQLSREVMPRPTAKAMGVLSVDEWKPVDPSTRCAHTRRGVVVHGGPLEVIEVCTAQKQCAMHWPPPPPREAPRTTASFEPDWEAEQRRYEEEREQWEAIRPAILPAFAQHLAAQPLTPITVARGVLERAELTEIEAAFGVDLTEDTALQVLVLDRIRAWNFESFVRLTERWGFDAKAFRTAWQKEQQAQATPATPKRKKRAAMAGGEA